MIHSNISLLLTLPLLLWISPFLAKASRLPTAIIEILLGAVAAYIELLYDDTYFNLIAEVGFLYLMFLAGLEVDLKSLSHNSSQLKRHATLFLAIVLLVTGSGGWFLQLPLITLIAMPLISVGLVASLSKEYGKEASWVRLAFLVGVFGEVVSIAALTILDALVITGSENTPIQKIVLLFLFLGAIWILYHLLRLLFWWFPELKAILIPKLNVADQDIRLAMALFFIMIAIMNALELELALGAFIAGVAISAFFHHEVELERKISAMGFGFLVPLFFIHVGATLDLEAIQDPNVLIGAAEIVGLMLLSRLLAGVALKRFYGDYAALLASLSLAMPLTLMIAVATIGLEGYLITHTTYYQLVLASVVDVLLAMGGIKLLVAYKEGSSSLSSK